MLSYARVSVFPINRMGLIDSRWPLHCTTCDDRAQCVKGEDSHGSPPVQPLCYYSALLTADACTQGSDILTKSQDI